MGKPLSEEQVRACQQRARANNSTLGQELFLERGGALQQWYWAEDSERIQKPKRPTKEVVEARMRAAAFRMTEELMGEFGSPLKKREILALCKAAHIIALEPDAVVRAEMERKTVDRAFEMVANGE